MIWPFHKRTRPDASADARTIDDPRFIAAVREHFTSRGLAVDIHDGKPCKYGLANLAQSCAGVPAETWPAAITGHFTRSEVADNDVRSFIPDSTNFAAVQPLLSLQLWPDDPTAVPLDRFVYRRDIPGLVTTLVYDLPSCTRSIPPEDAACWSQPREELFPLAMENLDKKKSSLKTNGIRAEGIGELLVVDGPEFTTASYALLIHRYKKRFFGPAGALLALPTSRQLLCLPLDPAKNCNRLALLLLSLAQKLHRDGPGSLTDQLYWHREGSFIAVPYNGAGVQAVLHPPAELASVLS